MMDMLFIVGMLFVWIVVVCVVGSVTGAVWSVLKERGERKEGSEKMDENIDNNKDIDKEEVMDNANEEIIGKPYRPYQMTDREYWDYVENEMFWLEEMEGNMMPSFEYEGVYEGKRYIMHRLYADEKEMRRNEGRIMVRHKDMEKVVHYEITLCLLDGYEQQCWMREGEYMEITLWDKDVLMKKYEGKTVELDGRWDMLVVKKEDISDIWIRARVERENGGLITKRRSKKEMRWGPGREPEVGRLERVYIRRGGKWVAERGGASR